MYRTLRSYLFHFNLVIKLSLLSLLIGIFAPHSALAASYVVSKTADTNDGVCDADCSLREAITTANTSPTDDTITFATEANGTITLASALPALLNNGTLTITGNGEANTIISGNHAVQGLNIAADANITLESLSITGGHTANGGGIYIFKGALTLNNSTVSGNTATSLGGGIYATTSTLTLNNSIINDNSGGIGGGIIVVDTLLTLNNSISSNNSGGGIDLSRGNTATLNNSTLSDGIYAGSGILTLNNSIIADRSLGIGCANIGATIYAFNSLIEAGFSCINGTNANLLTGDPGLNADLTLKNTSIAINAGNNSLIPVGITTDLAGNVRIQQGTVDMGAYESPFGTPTGPTATYRPTRTPTATTTPPTPLPSGYIVSKTVDTSDGVCDADCSLREAIIAANASTIDDSITFAASANGTILLASTLPALANNGTLTITGNGTANTIISGDNHLQIFSVASGATVTLDGLTIKAGSSTDGGGIRVNSGTLTLNNSTVSNNFASTTGGGIRVDTGTLTLNNSIVKGNTARDTYGGGIFSTDSTVTLNNSTVSSNIASNNNGGGIYNITGEFTLNDSTVTGNTSAKTNGGGIFSTGPLTLNHSTVTGNSAFHASGGGIYSGSSLTLTHSDIRDNTAISGGGIESIGTTTITNSSINGNTALSSGGGIYHAAGTLTLINSSVSNNTAVLNFIIESSGGGIFSNGTLKLTNSVVSNNATTRYGGGIYSYGGTVTLNNSTISGNSAITGSIASGGTMTLNNTIVANNVSGGDCSRIGGTINALNSLIEDGLDCINGTNTDNMTGDPELNSDLTLQNTSFAVNLGDNSLIPVGITTDLAGNPRIQQETVDMGAYESPFIPARPTPTRTPTRTPTYTVTLTPTATKTPTITMSPTVTSIPSRTPTPTSIPAYYIVSKTADTSDGVCDTDCSLREAITAANANKGDDTITFATEANGTIILASVLPTLANNGTLRITGNGVASTIISGNNLSQVFSVASGAHITLDDLSITGGYGTNGGGIANSSGTLTLNNSTVSGNAATSSGGGIANSSGTLTLNNSTVNGNTSIANGGGIDSTGVVVLNNSTMSGNTARYGGAIMNSGTMTLTNSTISNTIAAYGGIYNRGTLTLNNSIVSNNTATSGGGGIDTTSGTITLINSMVINNTATSNGSGIRIEGGKAILNNSTVSGNSAPNGSVSNGGTLTLNNSIIANSVKGSDCSFLSGTINALNSLIEDGLGCINGTNTNNLTGDPALNSDLTLQSTSIAIDAGNNSLIPVGITTDLAGNLRIAQSTVDMGAYEFNSLAPTPTNTLTRTPTATYTPTTTPTPHSVSYIVSKTADTNDGLCDADCSLREAITAANANTGNDTITFAAEANGTITLASDLPNIANNGTLRITGNGAANTIISGNNLWQVFSITNRARVTLDGLSVTEGYALNGGGIENSYGTLTLNNSSVSGNTATSGGGGIENSYGTLTLNNSNVSDNIAIFNGGGIDNTNGIVTLNNSIMNNNTAPDGGAILNNNVLILSNSTISNTIGTIGGAIFNFRGTVTLTNSTISHNTATVSGGGAYNYGGTMILTNTLVNSNTAKRGGGIKTESGTVTLNNSTMYNNQATSSGGAIENTSGTLTLNNSIMAHSVTGDDCSLVSGTINAFNSLIEDGLSCVNGMNTHNLTGDPALNADLTLQNISIAINAGDNGLIPVGITTDLTGNTRIQQVTVDMGAYESPFMAVVLTDTPAGMDTPTITPTRTPTATPTAHPTYIVTKKTDTNDSLCDADCSLREAIAAASSSPDSDTIIFAPEANGTITLVNSLPRLGTSPLTIIGNGTANTIINGNNAGQIFYLSGSNVTLNNLTITGGYYPSGAGIYASNSTLTLNKVTVSGNYSYDTGGGIDASSSALTLNNSTVSGNSAPDGGGIFADYSTLTLNNSFISSNISILGGGIFVTNTALTLNNTIVSSNSGGSGTGGINSIGKTLTLNNSTISGNIGGGIYASGTMILNNTIIANSSLGIDCTNGGGTINALNSLIEAGLGCINGTNTNNLTGDPALNSDLTLQNSSIAINAGDNGLIPGDITTDLAGNPRIQQGTVDMGAYEFMPPMPIATNTPTRTPTAMNLPTQTPAAQMTPDQAPHRNYFTTRRPTLTWSSISWAIRYELQIADNWNFTQATTYNIANRLDFTLTSDLNSGQYFWRVRACSTLAANSCGSWSAFETFVVAVQ